MRCLVVFVGVSSRSARSTGGAMSLHRVLLVCTLSLLAMTAAVAQATGTSLSNGSKEVYLLTADRVIDAHSHIFLHPYNETLWNDQVLHEPLPYRTIEAVRHVRATLLAGFTALRDLGTEGAGYADVDVQRAIDEGLIPGPHLFVATPATAPTGSSSTPTTIAARASIPRRRSPRRSWMPASRRHARWACRYRYMQAPPKACAARSWPASTRSSMAGVAPRKCSR